MIKLRDDVDNAYIMVKNTFVIQPLNMSASLYYGFPVQLDEAARILHLELRSDGIHRHYVFQFVKGMNEDLRGRGVDLRVNYTNKDQVVIGYAFHDEWAAWEPKLASETVDLLVSLKTKFFQELDEMGASYSEIDIYPMQCEVQRVSNPQPYVVLGRF